MDYQLLPEPAAPLPLTSFQRALKQADAMKTARALQPGWRDSFADEVYHPGAVYRPTEDAVLTQLYEAQRRRNGVYTLLEMAAPVLREVLQEMRTIQREKATLKELLAKQGKTLNWIDLGSRRGGKPNVVSVVVPLAPTG